MAKKENVAQETVVEVKAETLVEEPKAETIAQPQPAETAPVDTSKTEKPKTRRKEKSAKTETAPKKNGKFAVKKDAEKPVDEPKAEKPVEVSERDKMFPAEFEVHGIKFRRLELKVEKTKAFDGSVSDSFVGALIDAKNEEPDGCVLCIALQWDKDMLKPSGKKGLGKSLYEKCCGGIIPPRAFPFDLEICLVDAVLNARMEQVISHSLYTEYPGFTPFDVFDKRTKQGWFECNAAPFEVYYADFSEFKFDHNGAFVNLYEDK